MSPVAAMKKPDGFQDLLRRTLPALVFVSPEKVPQPFRQLLHHGEDMTRTLERWHRQPIHLRTLDMINLDPYLYRQVLLRTADNRTVEFGAIRIHLAHFKGEALERVLGCHQPLGGILHEFAIPFRSRLQGLLEVRGDERVGKILSIKQPGTLYGRQNALETPEGQLIAEVVEILPPDQNPMSLA